MPLVRGTHAGLLGKTRFSPLDIAGCQLWLRAEAGLWQDSAMTTPAIADGDVVGAWADQSGNANHATQATTSAKPTLKLAIVNSRPVVRFDGTDDQIVTASFAITATGDATVFWVYKPVNNFAADAGAARFGTYNVGGGNRFYFGSGTGNIPGKMHGNWGNQFIVGAVTIDTTNFSVVSTQRTGSASGNANTWINGAADINTTWASGTGDLAGGPVTIGGDSNGYLNGDIAEILVYNSALSTADRRRVERHLANKYGITLS